jgi:hypothetical protein
MTSEPPCLKTYACDPVERFSRFEMLDNLEHGVFALSADDDVDRVRFKRLLRQQ